jgi:hypothetical protein
MLKLFNDFAKSLFANELHAALPQYKHKKSLRGPLSGAANFEWKVDDVRIGWLGFGGFSYANFTAVAGWTTSGMNWKSLPAWEQYRVPDHFKVPPVPADGYVELRDRWRFEDADTEDAETGEGAWYDLELDSPPEDFARQVYEAYIKSPQFEEDVQRTHKGALRIYTKNPPTLEEQREQSLSVEWNGCRSFWHHLATRHHFSEQELEKLLRPPVEKAMKLVRRHAHPLICRQLGLATD